MVPGEKATTVAVVCYAIPGAIIGIALIYLEGVRRERAAPRPA
jgi:ABC-type Fe3+ transport system permease subunit